MTARTKKQPLSEPVGARVEGTNDLPAAADHGVRGAERYYFSPIASAERRLWAALVVDAVGICLGQTLVPRDERLAARRWIEARSRAVGGFLWCCHLLGLDEGAISERIENASRRAAMLERHTRPAMGFARPRRYRPPAAGGAATTFVRDSAVRTPLKRY